MAEQKNVTPEAMVIESYAIENVNLRLENARLKVALNQLANDKEEKDTDTEEE